MIYRLSIKPIHIVDERPEAQEGYQSPALGRRGCCVIGCHAWKSVHKGPGVLVTTVVSFTKRACPSKIQAAVAQASFPTSSQDLLPALGMRNSSIWPTIQRLEAGGAATGTVGGRGRCIPPPLFPFLLQGPQQSPKAARVSQWASLN